MYFGKLYGRAYSMVYSYNKLWKLLIDRKITKTEMRKRAGISTNMLAKMGKSEPVSMETLAKISTVLECGLDDIVEIQSDAEKGGN
jgi:DNA (cytosine-5)-methyltransferase 1